MKKHNGYPSRLSGNINTQKKIESAPGKKKFFFFIMFIFLSVCALLLIIKSCNVSCSKEITPAKKSVNTPIEDKKVEKIKNKKLKKRKPKKPLNEKANIETGIELITD